MLFGHIPPSVSVCQFPNRSERAEATCHVWSVLTVSTSALQDGSSRTEDGLKFSRWLSVCVAPRVLVEEDDAATVRPSDQLLVKLSPVTPAYATAVQLGPADTTTFIFIKTTGNIFDTLMERHQTGNLRICSYYRIKGSRNFLTDSLILTLLLRCFSVLA